MRSRFKVATSIATIISTVGAVAGAAAMSPTLAAVPATGQAKAVVPGCAWPIITNASKVNVAFPDTSATYWTTPFRYQPGMRLIVSGQYTDSRFMSFNTYDSSGGPFAVNGVQSGIFDYQINPNPGSRNPWQHRFARGDVGAGKKFTVYVQQAVPVGKANAIPLAPSGTAKGTVGFILMRVYLPKNGDISAVKLPNITVVTPTMRRTLAPCTPRQQRPSGLRVSVKTQMFQPARTVRANCTGSSCVQFSRATASQTDSVFPNSASAYVSAKFTPHASRVVLVRAKAPRTPALVPPGTQPLPWPSPRFQLQYYSLCNNVYRKPWPVIINKLPGGGTDNGCRPDNATKLDKQGRFTYVVGAQRFSKALSRWGKVTFVPTSNRDLKAQEVLIFRNMLSRADFKQSALNAPRNDNPQGAAAAMGQYYPRTTTCPTHFYVTRGPDACFATFK